MKLTRTAIIAFLVMLLATACSDSSSDSSMTESEYELVKEILALKDDVYNWAQDYAEWSGGDFAFIDSDGDGEYDEGESIIYTYTELEYDDEDTEGWTKTYDLVFEDGNAVNGSYTRTIVYDGWDDYWTEDESADSGYLADTYTQNRTYIYDFSATIDGEEHTLALTLYESYTVSHSGTTSHEYTDSKTVLDGVSIEGYEDYLN